MEEIIFPNQIRMIRRTRGKTMKEIASILNVSLSAISKIEKGYRRIDENQLDQIAHFLDCPKESVFVYEQTSQPEVLQAWQKEQDRRKQINEKSGLKTLGAGLRYIRGEKMLTLQDVAQGAGLTLSVYHRIEMGQREVSENQFKDIAHALGHTPETLQIQIYELDMAGSLQEFKKTGKPGIFHPKGGYNDLPVSTEAYHMYQRIPVYGNCRKDGAVTMDIQNPTDHLDPSFTNKEALYAVQLCSNRIGTIFPMSRTVLVADKDQRPQKGDVAFYRATDQLVEVGRMEDHQGLVFVQENPPHQLKVTDELLNKMDKVVYIRIA